jgi:hypothetical protein
MRADTSNPLVAAAPPTNRPATARNTEQRASRRRLHCSQNASIAILLVAVIKVGGKAPPHSANELRSRHLYQLPSRS